MMHTTIRILLTLTLLVSAKLYAQIGAYRADILKKQGSDYKRAIEQNGLETLFYVTNKEDAQGAFVFQTAYTFMDDMCISMAFYMPNRFLTNWQKELKKHTMIGSNEWQDPISKNYWQIQNFTEEYIIITVSPVRLDKR